MSISLAHIDHFLSKRLRRLEADKIELRVELVDHLMEMISADKDIDTVAASELDRIIAQAYEDFGGDGKVCALHDTLRSSLDTQHMKREQSPKYWVKPVLAGFFCFALLSITSPPHELLVLMSKAFLFIHLVSFLAALALRWGHGSAFYIRYLLASSLMMAYPLISIDLGNVEILPFSVLTVATIILLPMIWRDAMDKHRMYHFNKTT